MISNDANKKELESGIPYGSKDSIAKIEKNATYLWEENIGLRSVSVQTTTWFPTLINILEV